MRKRTKFLSKPVFPTFSFMVILGKVMGRLINFNKLKLNRKELLVLLDDTLL